MVNRRQVENGENQRAARHIASSSWRATACLFMPLPHSVLRCSGAAWHTATRLPRSTLYARVCARDMARCAGAHRASGCTTHRAASHLRATQRNRAAALSRCCACAHRAALHASFILRARATLACVPGRSLCTARREENRNRRWRAKTGIRRRSKKKKARERRSKSGDEGGRGK